MSVIYVIFIKDLLSPHLTLENDTNSLLEREIFNIRYDEIRVDFSNVKSMSLDFTNHYLLLKSKSKKLIHEVNIPLNLQKTFY